MGLYIGNNKYKVMIGNQKCSFVTEDKVLPYDAEIEYLESSGTQYIDTGVVPKTTLSVKIKYNILQLTPQNNIAIFGSAINPTGMFSGKAGHIYYINNTQNALPSIPGDFNTVLEEEYIDNTMTRNGVTYTTHHIVATNTSIILFGRHMDRVIERIGGLRIYYFALYDNGVLVRNLIPVRVGQVGYMYDKVSGQLFGNAGTGSFILGPDK